MSNIITAHFATEQTRAWTKELWQWDYGQILQFEGLDLPSAYEVHFDNVPHGANAKPQIGTEEGVLIPDEFLLSGECVYAWVYLHTGPDDGETEYMVTIPVTKRSKVVHEEPTPVQQAEIEQALAALNAAVDEAEDIADEWRNMTATAETLPEGSQATASYSEGTLTLGIPKGDTGAPGTNGRDGTDGTDGYSPSASVSKVGGTATITITDKDGTTTAQVTDGTNGTDGQPGADGYSPTASVSKSGDTATITITDENGTTTATVSDGAQGDPGPGVPTGGTTGQVLRKQSNDDFIAIWDREKVTDVQIDSTTILGSDGVANVPKASSSELGAVKVNGNGLTMFNSGEIAISPASSAWIKNATDTRAPITPPRQHEATFYGIAKAAGDSTQSASSNAVGTYTEGAKSSISDMLNAPESKSGTTVSITAKSGIRYKCGECATLDIVVPASGLFEVDFESGSTATVLTTTGATVTWPAWFDPTSLDADTLYEISIQDGRGLVATWPA